MRSVEIIDEPTAAALAYSFDRSYQGLIAVYDFGGGTFDFSVADVGAADIQIVSTAGDNWLGGDDFDEVLSRAAANAFWREHGIELEKQVVQWQRLMLAAEAAKRDLSAREETVLELPEAALTATGPLHLRFPLSRTKFSELSRPIIERSLDTCREALELCEQKATDLSAVYLSGGTCYIPAVREAVTSFFGKAPKVSIPPERAVVIGAAMYAAQKLSRSIKL
jgi:molecular chaperone DnaK